MHLPTQNGYWLLQEEELGKRINKRSFLYLWHLAGECTLCFRWYSVLMFCTVFGDCQL